MTTTVDPENSPAETPHPEDVRIEGTVLTPRQVGKLKIAVVVMGILLLAGFAAVIAGLIYQASKVGKKAPAEATVAAPPPDPVSMERAASGALEALSTPGDGEVVSMSLDGQRLDADEVHGFEAVLKGAGFLAVDEDLLRRVVG